MDPYITNSVTVAALSAVLSRMIDRASSVEGQRDQESLTVSGS